MTPLETLAKNYLFVCFLNRILKEQDASGQIHSGPRRQAMAVFADASPIAYLKLQQERSSTSSL